MSTTMVPCLPVEQAERTVILAAKHWRDVTKSKQTDLQAQIRAYHALIAAVAVLEYAEEQHGEVPSPYREMPLAKHDPTAGDPDSELVTA
jgi:hypothetical protein